MLPALRSEKKEAFFSLTSLGNKPMSSPYQEFVQKAKERFAARQHKQASSTGTYQFTLHSQYKMRQYGLSAQRVRNVIRNPKRREVGIVLETVAVMQPVSPKKVSAGKGQPMKEVWKQEIWVMFVVKNQEWGQKQEEREAATRLRGLSSSNKKNQDSQSVTLNSANQKIRIISAWRYPGVSPKRNPIPEEILRELEEGSILEVEDDNLF